MIHYLQWIFSCCLNVAIGIFVYLKGRRQNLNRTFAFFTVCIFGWSLGVLGLYVSPDAEFAREWARFSFVGLFFIPSAGFHFMVLLSKKDEAFYKKPVIISYIISAIFFLLNISGFLVKDFVKIGWKYTPAFTLPYTLFCLNLLFWIGWGIVLVFSVYKTSKSAIFRNQLKYFILGIVLTLLFGLGNFLLTAGLKAYPAGGMASIFWTGLVAYAIVKHRAMEIEIVIRQGIIYALLTAMLVGIYSLVVGIFYLVFGGMFLARSSLFVNAVTAMIIALMFSVVKDRIQNLVDRLFFRERHDHQNALTELARELNAIIEPGKLFSFIIDSITGTMHSERAFIMLMDERSGEFRIVQSRGIDDASARAMSLAESDAIVRWSREYKKIFTIEEFLERPCNEPLNATEQSLCNLASLVIPLICKGKHIGLVFLSEKMSGAIFNRDDINFLSAVATQASISVENAGLYESIINMEKKLHRADKLTALGTLAGSVAHEIKNPLVSIKTFTQLLPARFGDEVFRKKFERIVSEEIDRMENVVGQLLAFSRSSVTGGTEKQSEDVSIDATMEDLLELMKYEIYKNKIRIIKDYGENLPVIKGNARQLKQVFMNIILNAIQAMPSGGDITVGMHSADNNLEIYFQDTGSGISEEDISRIFTPFFTTKPEGTGLGLSISKRIIQEHSGHIAAGAAPSGGTRFTIKLPVPVPPALVSD